MDRQNTTTILLDTAELVCLQQARQISATHLNISGWEDIPAQQLQTARETLQVNGVLNPEEQINGLYLGVFEALFSPERSLSVFYNLVGQGRQELRFFSRQNETVLYTRLDEKKHRLESLAQPEQIATLLKKAFPLGDLPTGERFSIPSRLLENLSKQAAAGNLKDAEKTLESLSCNPLEKDLLLHAFQDQKISGSMLILDLLENGEAFDGFALALLADEQSVWLFHQPTPDEQIMIAQRNGALFASLLDIFSLRLTGGSMLNEPLDKNKITSFNLRADEFAFCFESKGRNDIALSIIESHFPGITGMPEQLERSMQEASDRLTARGWSKTDVHGKVTLAPKLESAISVIADYGFVMQLNILRPNLAARATIHVIPNKAYTSVLRPSQEVYFLEHGDISSLPTYISKLFLDFGENNSQTDIGEQKIAYLRLVEALEKSDRTLSAKILKGENMDTTTVNFLTQDIVEAVYRGSIVRINADSHASQDEIDGSVKPLLLLLRGPQRSWLYHFVASEGEEGVLSLVKNREDFLEQLVNFTD